MKESKVVSQDDPVQRPSSIATTSVDDATITDIVERVKGLSGRCVGFSLQSHIYLMIDLSLLHV